MTKREYVAYVAGVTLDELENGSTYPDRVARVRWARAYLRSWEEAEAEVRPEPETLRSFPAACSGSDGEHY